MHSHLRRHDLYIPDTSPRQPEIVPLHRLPYLIGSAEPTLVERQATSSESGSVWNTCAPGDNSPRCQKPTSTALTTTLPAVLGAVIPVVTAAIILFFLHRRHIRKLRNEDANDKHKSLDFGLDVTGSTSGRVGRRLTLNPFPRAHTKGVSLDIGQHLFIPRAANSSRNSLNSLSMSIVDDGKYRAANLFTSDTASMRSHSRERKDDSPSFTGLGEDMDHSLLRNAQRMSRSSPPFFESTPAEPDIRPQLNDSQDQLGFQLDLPRNADPGFTLPRLIDEKSSAPGNALINTHAASVTRNDSLSQSATVQTEYLQGAEPATITSNKSPHVEDDRKRSHHYPLEDHSASGASGIHTQAHTDSAQLPSIQVSRISLPTSDGINDYPDNRKSIFIAPDTNDTGKNAPADMLRHEEVRDTGKQPEEIFYRQKLAPDSYYGNRRLTLGLRPLPPEDSSDNPEQRANRIRSFYKEYFDESNQKRETTYYNDYNSGPYDGPYVDDYSNPPPLPFAEPISRRAMTPPPREPPQMRGPPRHMATSSMGGLNGYASPGPRAFSSASARLPGGRGPPRRPMKPPTPLQELPTPHLLNKDDAIMQAISFAPGKSYRDQKEGRAETPLGGLRPFMSMTPAASPLVSSFDELSAIPSAHALRKSGTYTNLDFAPPPRFRNTESSSDTGSIHSNRTGISHTHLQNIRNGAYRVSRLPTDAVGTKDDMMASLRPNWEMR